MISVIVPAYNEEEGIGSCLESLASQITKHSYEVVLIDNNSTDNTVKIAKSFAKKMNIRVINEPVQGRGMARYRGFEEARGEIIFSTDADTILPNTWIERFMEYFTDPKVVVVTSLCDVDKSRAFDTAIFKSVQIIANVFYRVVFGYYWISGFSYAIRREIYIKAGKINKSLNALDDIELGKRVSRFGKIKYVSDLPVLSSNRRFKKGVVSGLFEYLMPFIHVMFFDKKEFVMDNAR